MPNISDLIRQLQQIQKEHGDLPCALLDERVGYPASVQASVRETAGYDPKGYFLLKMGDEKICVIDGPW